MRDAGLEQLHDLTGRPGVGFGEGAFTDLLSQRSLHRHPRVACPSPYSDSSWPGIAVRRTASLCSAYGRSKNGVASLRPRRAVKLPNENAGGLRIRKPPAFG